MEYMNFARSVPVEKEYDVVVCGSGPAGIAAAVSSARAGADTLLFDRNGVLGGNLTAGQISPLLGSAAHGGFYDEMVALLGEGHENETPVVTRNGREIHIDHEEAKIRLCALCEKAGVHFMLSAALAGVVTKPLPDGGKKAAGVVLATPAGLKAYRAKVLIDATGDGTAAFLAGAEYMLGREPDGALQPCSLEFLIGGVDESRAISCFGGSDPVLLPDGSGREYREVCRAACEKGELPENVSIVRLHKTFYPGERSVNATQCNGVNALDLGEAAAAETVLRAQIGKVAAFLKNNVPGYENIRVVSSPSTLGVRETRRIVGDYIISDSDVENGVRFPDAAVFDAWFLIDIHNPKGGGQAEGHSKPAKPYDIPYRALLPRGIEGMLLAGRCISGTHRAHASYRVMAVCLATGEAAGKAAAESVRLGVDPRKLDITTIIKKK